MSEDTRRLQPKTDGDFAKALRYVHRDENIKKVLSVIAAFWSMGGVDSEGDGFSGSTRFWARRSTNVGALSFEIPNGALNMSFLTIAEIRMFFGSDTVSAASVERDQLCPAIE